MSIEKAMKTALEFIAILEAENTIDYKILMMISQDKPHSVISIAKSLNVSRAYIYERIDKISIDALRAMYNHIGVGSYSIKRRDFNDVSKDRRIIWLLAEVYKKRYGGVVKPFGVFSLKIDYQIKNIFDLSSDIKSKGLPYKIDKNAISPQVLDGNDFLNKHFVKKNIIYYTKQGGGFVHNIWLYAIRGDNDAKAIFFLLQKHAKEILEAEKIKDFKDFNSKISASSHNMKEGGFICIDSGKWEVEAIVVKKYGQDLVDRITTFAKKMLSKKDLTDAELLNAAIEDNLVDSKWNRYLFSSLIRLDKTITKKSKIKLSINTKKA